MEIFDQQYEVVDLAHWQRRQEYEFFSRGGCAFNVTCELDVTNARAFAKHQGVKFYPVLVAVAARALNDHEQFRYGWAEDRLVCFRQVHPLFFDTLPGGDAKCLCAPYVPEVLDQVAAIERVRAAYAEVLTYRPQGSAIPQNSVNLSCLPWIKFTDLSFCLQYTADYLAPMVTFGRFEERAGRFILPAALYLNHKVCSGAHAAMLIGDLQKGIDAL